MKVSVISFTSAGKRLSDRLTACLCDAGDICDGYDIHMEGISLGAWTRQQFSEAGALIFIGAAGIAVRAIAPYLKDKFSDPAVLVIDERGQYVISLLSGHVGGANALTMRVAGMIGAQPVITTASDVNGKTAIDVWAAEHGLKIGSRQMAKQVAAAVLAGEPVGFFDDEQMMLPVPDGCVRGECCRLNVRVTMQTDQAAGEQELHLIPPLLTLGIGCRRGTPAGQIDQQVRQVLEQYGLYREAVAVAASIDLKKDEAGLEAFSGLWGLPLRTYTAEELEQVAGTFSESAFVRQVTGIGNVCERAALLSAGPDAGLVVKKQAGNGVTVAVAKMKSQKGDWPKQVRDDDRWQMW